MRRVEALMTAAIQLLEKPDDLECQRLHMPIVNMVLYRYSDETIVRIYCSNWPTRLTLTLWRT